jgi:hypothetical protein
MSIQRKGSTTWITVWALVVSCALIFVLVSIIQNAQHNAKIKKEAHVSLDTARQGAELGDQKFTTDLILAVGYASEIGMDISARIEEINRIGLPKLVEKSLADARQGAELGNQKFTTDLILAKGYAKEIGMDISARIEEIKSLQKQ